MVNPLVLILDTSAQADSKDEAEELKTSDADSNADKNDGMHLYPGLEHPFTAFAIGIVCNLWLCCA